MCREEPFCYCSHLLLPTLLLPFCELHLNLLVNLALHFQAFFKKRLETKCFISYFIQPETIFFNTQENKQMLHFVPLEATKTTKSIICTSLSKPLCFKLQKGTKQDRCICVCNKATYIYTYLGNRNLNHTEWFLHIKVVQGTKAYWALAGHHSH